MNIRKFGLLGLSAAVFVMLPYTIEFKVVEAPETVFTPPAHHQASLLDTSIANDCRKADLGGIKPTHCAQFKQNCANSPSWLCEKQ